MDSVKGKIWKLGDNVNTDDIIPAIYLVTTDEKELAKHSFEAFAPGLAKRIEPGDILVAGENFGCGSSREHAPKALKGLGIQCVIAKSFARIFFRNSINTGLMIVECPEMYDAAETGNIVEVQFDEGVVKNSTAGTSYPLAHLPPFLLDIVSAGGLMEFARKNRRLDQASTGE